MEFMATLLKKSHDNINFFISLYILDHNLNYILLKSSSIVCQIHIENRVSECLVWPNLRKWMAKALVEISWIWFGSLITDSGEKLEGSFKNKACRFI